jgi:hypothetical protein
LRERDSHGDTEAARYKTRRKENKSKYELLENKINSNIDDFGSKLDHICKACTKQKCTEKSGDKHSDKEPHKDVLIIYILKSSRRTFHGQ